MSEQQKVDYFSLFSGEIYAVSAEDEVFLDAHQIPLKCKPKSSCKKCYGRLYTGYNPISKHYEICRKCGVKCIDMDKMITRKSK
jgi:hypothetical protein